MSYEEVKKRYKELLASGSKPSEALHIIEAEKAKGMHDTPKQEPIKDVRVSVPAPSGGSSKWSKIGAGIGKVAGSVGKFLFTPGGQGYNENPVRFKNSGRYKHQRKEKIVYVDSSGRPIQKKKTTKQVIRTVYVRESPAKKKKPVRERTSYDSSPFASDFGGGGGNPFSGGGGFTGFGPGSPFESDLGLIKRKKRKGR